MINVLGEYGYSRPVCDEHTWSMMGLERDANPGIVSDEISECSPDELCGWTDEEDLRFAAMTAEDKCPCGETALRIVVTGTVRLVWDPVDESATELGLPKAEMDPYAEGWAECAKCRSEVRAREPSALVSTAEEFVARVRPEVA